MKTFYCEMCEDYHSCCEKCGVYNDPSDLIQVNNEHMCSECAARLYEPAE